MLSFLIKIFDFWEKHTQVHYFLIFDFEEVQSRFITKIGYWNDGSWHNKDFQTGYFNFSFYVDGYKDRRFSGKIKWFKTNKECLQQNILWIPS